MNRKWYNEGEQIFKSESKIDRFILIQSGIVQLSIPYDKRVNRHEFVVERLTTGALLNHQAFVIKDEADTDYVCLTPVSCFELTYDNFRNVMLKRADLQAAQKDIKTALFQPQYQIALDYIYHNNTDNPDEYDMTLQRNAAKVKFKNAIMQVWTQVKRELQPKNIKQLVEEMLQKQLRKQEQLGLKKKDQDVEEDKTEEEQL